MRNIGGRLRTAVVAALFGAVFGSPATPARAAVPAGALPALGSTVAVSRLAAGGTAIVQRQEGAPVAALELWYRVPSTGFGAKALPGLARLAAQAVAASKPIVGTSLAETVAQVGGRLTISVYSDSVEIAALVPASAAARTLRVMTAAYFAPVLGAAGFASAQRDVGIEALFSAADVGNTLRDAVFAQLFRDGPQHFSTFADSKNIASLPFADVQSFALRAFRSSNATLVVTGAIDPSIAAAAAAGRTESNSLPEQPRTGALNPSRTGATIASQQPAGGFGWVGPPISDESDATAMDFIADYLFRPDTGTVTREVARSDPKAILLGQFITLHDPGVMFVAYAGDGASQVGGNIAAATAALERPLATQVFESARAAFEFHLLSDLQTPLQLADTFGWYAVEGNPTYAPGADVEKGAYFAAADALTPDSVAAVARKYLGVPPARVTSAPRARKAP